MKHRKRLLDEEPLRVHAELLATLFRAHLCGAGLILTAAKVRRKFGFWRKK